MRYPSRRILAQRLLLGASLPALPLLALQAVHVRRTTPRLPEPPGPRQGTIFGGSRPLSFAVLGESTAVGVGAGRQEDGLAVQLADLLAKEGIGPIRWQIVGQSGISLSVLRREWAPRIQGPVDVVIVMTGVNDVLAMTSERRWVRELQALVEGLVAQGAGHVLFPPVAPMGRFPALPRPLRDVLGARAGLLDQALQRAVASQPRARYGPTPFPAGRGYMATDGFHPSALGYGFWAAQLLPHVPVPHVPGGFTAGATPAGAGQVARGGYGTV